MEDVQERPGPTTLTLDGRDYQFYDTSAACGSSYARLPYCTRVLLECALRKYCTCPDPEVASAWKETFKKILNGDKGSEILFHPGRVVLQDFTGVAALVDLAAVRECVSSIGGDPSLVDSACPADLVVDHSVQVDYSQIAALAAKQQKELEQEQLQQQQLCQQMQNLTTSAPPPPIIIHSNFPPPPCCQYFPGQPIQLYPLIPAPAVPPHVASPTKDHHGKDLVPTDNPGLPIQDEVCPFHQRLSYWAGTLQKNRRQEMDKNGERFQFLKYVDNSFGNITVIPPGTGVMHQVNLEYLARVVTTQGGLLFPDSLVGTDTHTTMINGLGVLGWSTGTLEAEAVMFGHPVTMQLPTVIGVELAGVVPPLATSTDVVLLVAKELRKTADGTCDTFVEFFGPGVDQLSMSDRSAIANLSAEYGALVGYFPVDDMTIAYLAQTGREKHSLLCMRTYLDRVSLLRETGTDKDCQIKYDQVVTVDLGKVMVTVSGPKKTKDKVQVDQVAKDFWDNLHTSFDLGADHVQGAAAATVDIDGELHTLKHGTVLLSSIASCSNTSNPSVMLTAGLLAKKAVEAGLSVPKYVKRSLSPGSGIVTSYLQDSGVMPYLHMLGFEIMGYGCSACVENSAQQQGAAAQFTGGGQLVCCGVLAGNRNFEGRLDPGIKANYLASPPLVVAYAIAGRIDVDFQKEPLGYSSDDKPVFLADIWPSRQEVGEVEQRHVIPAVFKLVSNRVSYGNKEWSALPVPQSAVNSHLYHWCPSSTFIQPPSYIQEMMQERQHGLTGMRCLLKLEDNVSSDQISPAGSIVRNSPAADYLSSRGLVPRQFHSYGARRGNSQVMARGTFAHVRLKNVIAGHNKVGPYTIHQPSGVPTTVFEASQQYKKASVPLLIICGDNFGRGAARDWATKGPYILGVRAILAISFHPPYRANLVKNGILPLNITRDTFDQLSGAESYQIVLPDGLLLQEKTVQIKMDQGTDNEKVLTATHRLDNGYEVKLYKDGGVIQQTVHTLVNNSNVAKLEEENSKKEEEQHN